MRNRLWELPDSALKVTPVKIAVATWAVVGLLLMGYEHFVTSLAPLLDGPPTWPAVIYVAVRFSTAVALVSCAVWVVVILFIAVFGVGRPSAHGSSDDLMANGQPWYREALKGYHFRHPPGR